MEFYYGKSKKASLPEALLVLLINVILEEFCHRIGGIINLPSLLFQAHATNTPGQPAILICGKSLPALPDETF
jgi:hypothetical protein